MGAKPRTLHSQAGFQCIFQTHSLTPEKEKYPENTPLRAHKQAHSTHAAPRGRRGPGKQPPGRLVRLRHVARARRILITRRLDQEGRQRVRSDGRVITAGRNSIAHHVLRSWREA